MSECPDKYLVPGLITTSNPKVSGLHPKKVDQVLSITVMSLFFFANFDMKSKSSTLKFNEPGDSTYINLVLLLQAYMVKLVSGISSILNLLTGLQQFDKGKIIINDISYENKKLIG